ncbi:SDR family oxidoreductase [uncultured Desulfosarcina sp.]|uniref:SDR family oxidoreductase n=1 Tax=uncultured Desulfosarcina sp. TaxID=218289 RepID=UPI0029C8EBBF|nr:SDR family oxidoreductase [uncultured Desulfosarcina sp.]
MAKKVLITGITGTLGSALGELYLKRGWEVHGVTRQSIARHPACSHVVTNDQSSIDDALTLLKIEPDLVYLNAGAIEKEIGAMGEPLSEVTQSITTINYTFPAVFALEAAKSVQKPMDIIAIGSIADGSPSAFGPVYHASKAALHYFIQGTSPILGYSNPNIKLRLYRPGAIHGPLSWAPVNRLNEKGHKVRAKRCNNAPPAEKVALHVESFQKSSKWVINYDEPISFKFLKFFFALAPNLYCKMQHWVWRRASKFKRS